MCLLAILSVIYNLETPSGNPIQSSLVSSYRKGYRLGALHSQYRSREVCVALILGKYKAYIKEVAVTIALHHRKDARTL